MRYFLSAIAGVVTSFDFPVYDWKTGRFSIMNTLLLAVICVAISSIARWLRGTTWKPVIKLLTVILVFEILFGILGLVALQYVLDRTPPHISFGVTTVVAVIIALFVGRTIHFIGEKMEQLR